MFGGEPGVAVLVEGDAADLFRGQTVLGAVVLKQPVAVLVLADAVGDAAAVRTNPHMSSVVALQDDDVIAHQHLITLRRHLQFLDLHLLALIPHNEDTVGGACPHVSFNIYFYRSDFQIGIVLWVVLHPVLRMLEDEASPRVLDHKIHTAAVGRDPDISLLVLYGVVGGIVAEALRVALLITELLDIPAAVGFG